MLECQAFDDLDCFLFYFRLFGRSSLGGLHKIRSIWCLMQSGMSVRSSNTGCSSVSSTSFSVCYRCFVFSRNLFPVVSLGWWWRVSAWIHNILSEFGVSLARLGSVLCHWVFSTNQKRDLLCGSLAQLKLCVGFVFRFEWDWMIGIIFQVRDRCCLG